MLISQNKLSELTGKDRKTVKKLLAEVPSQFGPHRALLYDLLARWKRFIAAMVMKRS
jgi:hypothetical protein